ncbi:GNAT family N-acetyltransferase [Paenibacillus sinopodophylli]|uniref:GNAT family N-acetyltransferase n=1 Tax=Paenibacillus sinopodophylli TaxID=1837342 RepID=UPI00110CCB0C|nr:GNAT family protein [Paenibacillus sinopodophylli]
MNHFFNRDIVLENAHVKLVPFSESYEDELRNIIFDHEITKYTGNHFVDQDDLKRYMSSTIASRMDNSSYPFIVIDKASGQVAGSSRFGNIVFHSKRLEIGWTWYGAAFRGTIVNQATKFELLTYAFEQMEFNRVQFSVDAENMRSQKAVLKLGATQEGVFRCNYMDANGQCRDDVYFSILKSEWPKLKRTVFHTVIV